MSQRKKNPLRLVSPNHIRQDVPFYVDISVTNSSTTPVPQDIARMVDNPSGECANSFRFSDNDKVTSGDSEMPEPYSNREIDLKMENLEQRLDSKLDKVLFEVKEGFLSITSEMAVIRTEIKWIGWITGATFIAVVGALITAAIKVLYGVQ